MKKRRILVVDATGRGHAISDAFRRTDGRAEVHYGPGNTLAEIDGIMVAGSVALTKPESVVSYCRVNSIDLAFVSHIDALSSGTVDALQQEGIPVIGATAGSVRLEADKAFCKSFCHRHGIPTPAYREFTDPEAAREYIRQRQHPVVIKANGFCENGDGAYVTSTIEEAEAAVEAIMIRGRHGRSGSKIIVEERVFGPEISVFALLDGRTFLPFPSAMDYKRVGDRDAGQNCDGMGSISPHPFDSPALRLEIAESILMPLMRGLQAEDLTFTGFIFIGAMITRTGLQVLEINTRFGDSEAEVVFPSLQSSLLDLCDAALEGRVGSTVARFDNVNRCGIVLAQGATDGHQGWPQGDFETGIPISGIENAREEASVFFAGIKAAEQGSPVTAGGRVLHVVGSGTTMEEAYYAAYKGAHKITFRGLTMRSDIGRPLPAETSTAA